MSVNLRNYVKSLYAFEHVLRLTPDAAWSADSPCEGWTGKDVYDHVVGGVEMVRSFALTSNAPESTPTLGDDPLGQWSELRDATLEALDQQGVLQSLANDPFGPELGPLKVDVLVGFMAADVVAHVWDLARTAGVDDRLDPALCEAAYATWTILPAELLRGQGMFGPAVEPAADADIQTKLLNFLGRSG